MNRNYLLRGWVLFFLFAILVTGCNKDEEELPPDFAELSFDDQAVLDRLPDGLLNSTDPKAQECVEMIEEALDMSAFQSNLLVPDNAQRSSKKASGETWYWTFSYMGGTWTFYWTFDEDNSMRYWTMEIQFGDGPRYDYITAWENKDGTGGEVVYSFNWVQIYDQEQSDYVDLHWTYSWNLDSMGNYYFTWSYDSDGIEYDYYMNYSIVINADGSGELDYYFLDELYYHMEWDAAGNGSWHYYFGGLDETGSWTAG
ncbi:MAG: hypothetical protein P1P86_10430 [Bacteroidales bacterium]|nr:hypothetical protein [Bacteroidales bacterium]